MKLGDLGTATTAQGDLAHLALTQGDQRDLSGNEEGAQENKEED